MLKLKPNIFTSQLLVGKFISVQSHHGLSIYVKVIRVNTYINKDTDKLTKNIRFAEINALKENWKGIVGELPLEWILFVSTFCCGIILSRFISVLFLENASH